MASRAQINAAIGGLNRNAPAQREQPKAAPPPKASSGATGYRYVQPSRPAPRPKSKPVSRPTASREQAPNAVVADTARRQLLLTLISSMGAVNPSRYDTSTMQQGSFAQKVQDLASGYRALRSGQHPEGDIPPNQILAPEARTTLGSSQDKFNQAWDRMTPLERNLRKLYSVKAAKTPRRPAPQVPRDSSGKPFT